MSNKHKSTAVVLLCFLFVVLMNPALSNNIMDIIVKKRVSESFNQQIECLAETIYYEAGSESYEGKLSVAQVVLNRVNNYKFPKDICSVVYQKNNGVYQFSWVGLVLNTSNKDKYVWQESNLIAHKALMEPYLHDVVYKTNSLYYHNTSVSPNWKLKRTTQIGHHIFYSET
jgi:spore germination cell wall hydrolase CwlJ-like protein